jgi:hypothetical protein
MAFTVAGLRVRLVKELQDDKAKFLHWGSVQMAALGGVIVAGIPVLADHFATDIAPALLQYLPSGKQSLIGVINALLFILARVVKVEKVQQ